MKKAFYILSAFAILVGTTVIPFGVVNAASSYDNHIQTTTSYTIQVNGMYEVYSNAYDAANWQSDINSVDHWYSQANMNDKYPHYQDMMQQPNYSKIEYKLTQFTDATQSKYITNFYTIMSDQPINLQWDADGVNACTTGATDQLMYTSRMYQYAQGGPNDYVFAYDQDINNNSCTRVSSSVGYNAADAGRPEWKIVATSGTINANYPEGYAGQSVPTTYLETMSIKPDLSIQVKDRLINLEDRSLSFPTDVTNGNWAIKWELYDDTTGSLLHTEKTDATKGFEYTVPKYGDYRVDQYFIDPTTREDFTPEESTDKNYVFDKKSLKFKVDGTTYSINTKDTDNPNLQCDEITGVCVGQSSPIYEVCDWANLGCHFRNFQVWLGDFFRSMFIPEFGAEENPFSNFQSDNHGLTSVITAPLVLFTDLKNAQHTCTPVQLPMPYIGNNLTLPCMQPIYEANYGQLYGLWQMVINGIVGYYVVIKMLAMVKGFKDPQNDRIEVTKL